MRRTTSIGSSPQLGTSFSQLAEVDPEFKAKAKKSAGSTDEDDRMSVSMAGDEDENDSSPPTTNGGDEQDEMFSLEMTDGPAMLESSKDSSLPNSNGFPIGPSSSSLAFRHSSALNAKLPPTLGFAVPSLPVKSNFSQFGMPASAAPHFAAPAPKLGFFVPREVERSTARESSSGPTDMEL